jgi:hypothetical protein
LIQKAKTIGAGYFDDCLTLLTSTDNVEVQKILNQINASITNSGSLSTFSVNKNLLIVNQSSFSQKPVASFTANNMHSSIKNSSESVDSSKGPEKPTTENAATAQHASTFRANSVKAIKENEVTEDPK